MVLVDTSVWISHFRKANKELQRLLLEDEVLSHPFIIGEMACGLLRQRTEILSLLQSLPQAKMAEFNEALEFIEHKSLQATGIGFIDVHLLAATLLSNASLWTLDKRLQKVTAKHHLLYTP